MRRDRRGFSLAELLVVAVVGAFIVMAVFQVLVTNQRAYTGQSAAVRGQQSIRAGLDVLFSELREVSLNGGDILIANTNSITIRTMRHFGLVCAVDYPSRRVKVKKVGGWFSVGDSVVVLADNDPAKYSDDVWQYGTVSAVDTAQSCTGADRASYLSLPLMAGSADTIRSGAPVRSYEIYQYGLETIDGEPYLARRLAASSTWTPLAGPLKSASGGASSAGVVFRYYTKTGASTATIADIAQIEVVLRTLSDAASADGTPISDSLSARIRMRN